MSRREKDAIFGLLFLMACVFYTGGIGAVWKFICELSKAVGSIFIMFNRVAIEITGDSILTLLLSSSITFLIVGIVLDIIDAPRGKIGSVFGKVLFWIVGFPVSFALNFTVFHIFKLNGNLCQIMLQ